MLEIDNITVNEQDNPLGTKIETLDFGVNGIYAHTSINYASIPIQVLLPILADMDSTFTKLEAKICLDYDTQGTATMDASLLNYTDGGLVTGTEKNYPNSTWTYDSSNFIDITAFQGKAVRVQTKRNGGTGANDVSIEGLVLILKYS